MDEQLNNRVIRVLLVDDEAEFARYSVQAPSKTGYTVKMSFSGKKLLGQQNKKILMWRLSI
jgi:hypothetical protein